MMKLIVSRLTLILCCVFLSTALSAQEIVIKGNEIDPGSMQAAFGKKFRSFRLFSIQNIDLPSLETRAIRLTLGNDNVDLQGAHSPLTDRNSRIIALTTAGKRYQPFPDLLFLNGAHNRVTVGKDFLAGELAKTAISIVRHMPYVRRLLRGLVVDSSC